VLLKEYYKFLVEVDISDDEMIKYKQDGENKEMPAKSAKTMGMDHPAKQAYDALAKGDDAGAKKGVNIFDKPADEPADKPKSKPKSITPRGDDAKQIGGPNGLEIDRDDITTSLMDDPEIAAILGDEDDVYWDDVDLVSSKWDDQTIASIDPDSDETIGDLKQRIKDFSMDQQNMGKDPDDIDDISPDAVLGPDSENDIAKLNTKQYSDILDMDIKDLDNAIESAEREAEELDSEVEELVNKHNKEFSEGNRPDAFQPGNVILPREKQKDPELYDRWKASMDGINEKKKRREDVKDGISRIQSIADDKVSNEKKNDAIGSMESDGVDSVIDLFKDAGKEEIYIDDDEGNEHGVTFNNLSKGMQQKMRDKLKPQYDKLKAAKDKMDSLDYDEDGYDDAEQAYEMLVDEYDMELYDFELMFDFVQERILPRGALRQIKENWIRENYNG